MDANNATPAPIGTPEQYQALLDAIHTLRDQPGALMPILQKAQEIYGYLPIEVQRTISRETQHTLEECFGIATFYSQFSLTPKGRHRISVCLGTACYVRGSGAILETLEKMLDIQSGECTEDGKFSLDSCRCVGACGLAPVMLVDDDVYGRVTVEQLSGILEKYE